MICKKIMVVCAAWGVLLSGCSGDIAQETKKTINSVEQNQTEQNAHAEVFAMDTYMTVTAYGEHAQEAVDRAIEEIERLDIQLSADGDDSEIAKLNQNGSAILSEDAGYLVERSLQLYRETDGAFDIAIYPVMEAWGFTKEDYRIPGEEELTQLLTLTDASDIEYDADSRQVILGKDGMKIDLGGIAKGYTSSRIIDIYEEYGIESGLINLGGNVQVKGTKVDGSKWRVAIQSPDNEEDYIGILETQDKAVITSGGYERYFEEDGTTYHHIIDSSTGYPAKNGLISVTIVSADGTLADGLSTSLFIMGKDKAISFWRDHSEEFDAILETEDKTLIVTEGIAETFTSELQTEVIKK